jgi:polysaccharide pyruvyl transferase WcaK-like protein
MVSVHGSYFGYNFGDTLLCAIFSRWVEQAGAPVNLPLANGPNHLAIGAASRGLFGFLRAKKLVFCGGGYFGEPAKGRAVWAVRNYFRHVLLGEVALLMGKPVAILGTGVGPVSAGWLRRKIIRLFNRAAVVVVRDRESADYLVKHGFTGKLEIASDAAISLVGSKLPKAAVAKAADVFAKVGAKKKVFLHLQSIGKGHDAAVFAEIERFLKANKGVVPVAITDSKPRKKALLPQQETARKIVQRLPGAMLWEYDGDLWALAAMLGEADLIITNKLHVGIVGSSLGKFVVSLPHHVKTPRFYNQMGLGDRCVQVGDGAPAKVAALLKEWKAGGKTDLSTLRKRAKALPYKDLLKAFVAR